MADPWASYHLPRYKKTDALGVVFFAGARCSWFLPSRLLEKVIKSL